MASDYRFHSGLVADVDGVYSIQLLRRRSDPQQYDALELMRMGGDTGRDYLADAAPKLNQMLADHGPVRTERAARTWGHLHGAEPPLWRPLAATRSPSLDRD